MIDAGLLLKVFKSAPAPCIIVQADAPRFTIVEANDAFLNTTHSSLDSLLLKALFKAFPNNPNNSANNNLIVEEALMAAIKTNTIQKLESHQYDIPVKGATSFEERYWTSEISPIANNRGEVTLLAICTFDNTENVLAEKAAALEIDKAKELLGHAEEVSNFGTWELDLDTNKLYWSDGVYRMCEYDPKLFEVTVEKAVNIIHPDDRERALQLLQQTLTDGRDYYIEKRFVTRTGRIKFIVSRASIIKNDEGKPIKLAGVFQDITEQIKAHEELTNTQDKFQGLVQNIDGIFWEADAQTFEFTFISPQVQQLLGYTPSEWLGQKDFWQNHIYPPDKDSAIEYCHQQIVLGKNHVFEYRMLTADNRVVWVRDSVSVLMKNGKPTLLCGLIVDITEKKAAEERIKQLYREFELLLQSTDEGLYGINKNGLCTFINNAAAQMLGYEPQQCIGKNMHQLIHYRYEDGTPYAETECPIFKAKDNTEGCRVDNEVFWRADGSPLAVRYSSRPIIDQGQHIGAVVMFTDISEAKKAAKDLQQSREELQKILNQSADIICTISSDGYFVNINAAAKDIWGYTPAELVGKPFIEFVLPEDHEKTLIASNAILSGVEMTNFENRYVRKDGSIVPMVWSARFYAEEDLTYCIARDATEKNKSEKSLQLSEQRFKSLVQDGSDLIAILDLEGNYVYASPTSASVLNMQPSEFIGRNAFEFIHPDDAAAVGEGLLKLQTQKRVLIAPFRFRHHDGSWRWIETIATNLLADPAVNGIVANSRDVTERIKAERELKESETKLRTATKIAKLGYWRYYVPDKSLYWSDEVYEIWGLNKEEVLLTPTLFYNTIHPEDLESYRADKAASIAGEKEHNFEFRILLPDKSIKWVQEKGELVRNNDGEPLIFEGTVQDVTPQKLLSLSLKESNQRYQYVTKATFDAIWDLDLIHDELYWGEGFETLFGYKLPNNKGSVSSWYNHIHEMDRPRVLESINKVLDDTSAANWMQEYRYIKANGDIAFVIDKGLIIRQPNGKAYRMVGAMQDVTKQKQEEQRLKMLESVITNTNDAVLITTADEEKHEKPIIIFVNDAFTKMTGYTAEEVLGRTPQLLQGPNSNRQALDRLEEARRLGQSCEITTVNYKKNGQEFWVSISISPVADANGVITHWVAIERDITQSKNEELQKVLLSEISNIFNQPGTLAIMLQKALEKIAVFGNFNFAEAWLVNAEKKWINLSASYLTTEEMQAFLKTDVPKSFAKGVGLPGIIWETNRFEHWRHADEVAINIRAEATKVSNIKTIYGLPLHNSDEVTGVLLLGTFENQETPTQFSALFENLSTLLSAEIKRKQLEQDLSNIFSFAPDVICIASLDGYFKKINPAACDLLEYTEEELLAVPYSEFVHPNDRDKTIVETQSLRNGRPTLYFENRYITKSGKIKWLAWTATPSPDQGLMFAVAKDITEKKNLEDLLDKATNMAQIGSWEVDLISNTVYWSDITKKIHGVGANYIPTLDNGINFYKQGYNRAVVADIINRAIKYGTPWDEELQIITAQGNEKWIRTIGNTEFVNGKCVRLYGSFQDINARKKASMDVAIALEEKSIILESIGDGFFAMDQNWIITYWNAKASKLLSIKREDILGKNLWDVFADSVEPDFYTYCHKAVEEFTPQEFEIYYDKLAMWCSISMYPTQNGLAVYFKDITERKNDELQLQKLNQELAVSNKELEQFAYVASHDLQEPLRMVTSFLTQLEKKYGTIIDDKGKQYIHFAVDGAKRMRQIILDLLEFSRVGRTEAKLQEVDLNELIQEILVLHRKQIQEKNAVITFSGLPVIHTFPALLRQVFQNLISNSLKYHKEGTAPQIIITSTETKTHWQFAITDNGIGIDPQFFDKIFIIFQRLHNKEDYSGTGIGLAITKKIIENLGGSIWLESEEGKGSTFYFTIAKEMTQQ